MSKETVVLAMEERQEKQEFRLFFLFWVTAIAAGLALLGVIATLGMLLADGPGKPFETVLYFVLFTGWGGFTVWLLGDIYRRKQANDKPYYASK